MKTIISITSIPSRFSYLNHIIKDLLNQKNVDEIWVNIPYRYGRFPELTTIDIPSDIYGIDPKVKIHRCDDYGPGTMYIAPALVSDADVIIVVNDDTAYPPNLSTELIRNFNKDDEACWCLSGFNIDEYIKGNGHVGYLHCNEIDVTESYGGVILKREWIVKIINEFMQLHKLTYNDDIIIGNLFAKYGIKKKIVCSRECNIGHVKQYNFGMESDALFYNNGDGTHFNNNLKIFKQFKQSNVYYF